MTDVTLPPETTIVASPPVPSPLIRIPEIVPEFVVPTPTPAPSLFRIIVWISPSTAAFLIFSFVASPHFSGRGMYFVVTNFTISDGDIVYKYFHMYPSVPPDGCGAVFVWVGSVVDFCPSELSGFDPLLIQR